MTCFAGHFCLNRAGRHIAGMAWQAGRSLSSISPSLPTVLSLGHNVWGLLCFRAHYDMAWQAAAAQHRHCGAWLLQTNRRQTSDRAGRAGADTTCAWRAGCARTQHACLTHACTACAIAWRNMDRRHGGGGTPCYPIACACLPSLLSTISSLLSSPLSSSSVLLFSALEEQFISWFDVGAGWKKDVFHFHLIP